MIKIIDFYNVSCGPCRAFLPIFDKVSTDYPDIIFEKVIADDNMELCIELGISSVPTLVFFDDDKVIHKHSGALSENMFRKLIEEHTSN